MNQECIEVIEKRIKDASKSKFMYLERIGSISPDEDKEYNKTEYLKYLAIEQELLEIKEWLENEKEG